MLGGHWGGVARNYPKNLGLSGQLILPIGPALELRGGGMLSLTGASLLHLEGGLFLGVPFARRSADVELSRGYAGANQVAVERATVTDATRAKFGVDLGLALDRRDAYYFERGSKYGDPVSTLTSWIGHAGLAFVRQVTAGCGSAARRCVAWSASRCSSTHWSRPSSRTRSPRGRPKIAPRATAGAWGSSGP